MLAFMTQIRHYIGICLVLVVAYFLGSSLIDQLHQRALTGSQIVATAPTAAPGLATAMSNAASALKDKALADALAGRAADLSVAQQTVAQAVQATGMASRLASALAEGLTKPSPTQQQIAVGTKTATTISPPPVLGNDDQIKRDLKDVLAQTTVKTQVDTSVNVTWQPKPFSPIFAVYNSDGTSGAGYTLHHAPALDIDALATISTPVSGSSRGIEAGIGVEHILKGTSAGLGVDTTWNFVTHKPQVGLYAAIHF